jgi:carboxyl-terminal processing protease
MKKYIFIAVAAIVGLIGLSSSTTQYFEIAKNFEIFGSLFRELNTYYVDEIDPNDLMQEGINAMLESLDPYTNFYSEADIETFRFETTGKYGGIGSLIRKQGDYIVITEPYEGFPAAKAGMMAGDKIAEVDGKSVKGKNSEEVSKFLKGEPGSTVNVRVLRPQADGKDKEMDFALKREEVKVKNVPYYGFATEDIGFINLANFTQFAGKEVEDAFKDLKKQNPEMKALVLDVRGNPGGLLNEAVNIVNIFVDKGHKVVFTRGKVSDWDKEFKTLNEAYDTKIPVAVLTSRGSASASEIVSGAIQDLDRGIVVGQKTFGKGLVQTTRKLSYNTQLKVTTAKYYIPSGRCIQAINYAEKDEEGAVLRIPDSLKVAFKTSNGRTVYDGGGVDPDILVDTRKLSDISVALLRKDLIFDYATLYRAMHQELVGGVNFRMTDKQFDDFNKWLKGKEYDYTTRTEKLLEDFKESAVKDGYFDAIESSYLSLKKDISRDKERDIEKNKDEIKMLLENEIVKRYYFRKGAIENNFAYDEELKKAVEILNDRTQYKQLLGFKN